MENTSLELAKSHYVDIAAATEGQSGTQVVDNLQRRAEELRQMSAETHDQITGVLATPNREQADVRDELEGMQGETARQIEETLAQAEPAQKAELLSQAADELEDGAKTLRDSFGDGKPPENAELADGVAGQAMLNRPGSQQFDARKVMGQDAVVDKDAAVGLVAHEDEHTRQKVANAAAIDLRTGQQVQVAEDFVRDDHIVTATELYEAGAMAAQAKVAPKSIDGLHPSYIATRRKLSKLLPDQQITELARAGDLTGLAATVRQERPDLVLAA
jgi:hypothetical protein